MNLNHLSSLNNDSLFKLTLCFKSLTILLAVLSLIGQYPSQQAMPRTGHSTPAKTAAGNRVGTRLHVSCMLCSTRSPVCFIHSITKPLAWTQLTISYNSTLDVFLRIGVSPYSYTQYWSSWLVLPKYWTSASPFCTISWLFQVTSSTLQIILTTHLNLSFKSFISLAIPLIQHLGH